MTATYADVLGCHLGHIVQVRQTFLARRLSWGCLHSGARSRTSKQMPETL